ncbi:ABC transporter permease [Gordonia oryzae]|uniref:Transport permease protein n=1 Tax=Gordonia oryzae TaxID=2487349 RepID=A0A3N4G6J9_9ACTN|nr:ABC transporter permease [Gordonia oryzae]RPA57027.1 ABC transporter permease [Gordonia oryzae]
MTEDVLGARTFETDDAIDVAPTPAAGIEWPITPLDRVPLTQALRQILALARRGFLRMRHSPQGLIDVVVVPIVFTVMFANIFGGAVAGGVGNYLQLLVPGVLVSVSVTTSIVTGTQLREDIDSGVFDRIVSMPIARIAPLAGLLIADTARYLIATTVSLAAGLAIGYRPTSALGVLLGMILVVFAAFSLSWIFALMGVLLSKVSAIQGISMLILMPMTFTSNAFVPTSTMPGWLGVIAEINPISHLISSFRALASHGQFTADVGWTLLGCCVILVIFAPATLRAYLTRL